MNGSEISSPPEGRDQNVSAGSSSLRSGDDSQPMKSDRQKLIELVRENTAKAQALDVLDRAKREISDASKASYERHAKRRLKLFSPDLGQLMEGVTASSWNTIRAALLFDTAIKYRTYRRACDAAQKAGDLEKAYKAALLCQRALDAHERIISAVRPEQTAGRKTKRKTLPRTDNWQARVFDVATPAQKPAVALMWAVGCRPREIESGVDVKVRMVNGEPSLVIEIPGAKVTETSGQKTRRIVLSLDTPQAQALQSLFPPKVYDLTIQRKAKRCRDDFEDIRQKTGWKISPYSMRHQVSANLKAELGPEQAEFTATALGHQTTRSQHRYGSARQAQKGGSGIVSVKGATVVRETRSAYQAAPEIPEPSRTPRP